MSRETKIGLVVSCSFLCLVGTVVYLKLKQGAFWPSTEGDADAALVASEGPPAEPEPAAEASKPKRSGIPSDDESPPSSGTQPNSGSGSESASTGDEQSSGPAMTEGPVVPAVATSRPATLRVDPARTSPITTPSATPATKPSAATPVAGKKQAPSTPAAEPPAPQYDDTDETDVVDADQSKPAGAGAVSTQSTATASPNTQSTKAKTEQPATVQKDPAKPMTTPKREPADTSHAIDPPPAFPNSNDPFKKLPDPPEDLDTTSGTGGSPPPASEFAKDGVNSQDAPSTSRSTGVREQANNARMEQSSAATQSPDSSASTPAGVPATPRPEPTGAAKTTPAPAPTPESGVSLGQPTVGAGAVKDQGNGLTPGVSPIRPGAMPPAGDDAPDRNSRPVTTTPPSPPDSSSTPRATLPGPATQSIITPVSATPAAAATAQAESWDEETYLCRENDSFKSISERFYRTDRYERALLLFNRNHPLAADWTRQDAPTLPVGQAVYIPPSHMLDKRYTGSIPGLTMLPERDAAAAGGSGAANSKKPEGYQRYKVRPGGEKFLEIARRTLNSSERWSEIYRLNRLYKPNDLIPAGTILWLPADARLEPADTP